MEFGFTYILLFGFKIFEPTVILTNFLIFLVCIYYFNTINKYEYIFAKQIALFVLLMGVSSCFASIGHAVQLQAGVVFFKIILFISHSFNLASLYFCFRAAYTFSLFNKTPNKYLLSIVVLIAIVMLILATITGTFIYLKIPAGVVLVYSLVKYYLGYKSSTEGNGVIVIGLLISSLSIFVHSFRLQFSDWFNHKDIAHVIVAVSLILICEGVKIIVTKSSGKLVA